METGLSPVDLPEVGPKTSRETDLLETRGLCRAFGETRALVSASLVLSSGKIHALAGENGSGKTTLIKILSGVLRPDGGELRWQGRASSFTSPASAQAAGISTVFQETLVVPELSVRDNIFLGTDTLFLRRRSRKEEVTVARAALRDLGIVDLDLERPMWTLSLAERQVVTIARATVRPWQLLILDEATSALDARQRARLFAYLRGACSDGRSVLFTSHRMDEVAELADTVSVLRLGKTVASVPMAATSPRQILVMMAGRDSVDRTLGTPPTPERSASEAPGDLGDEVLRVKGLVLRGPGAEIDLALARGEILGLAGLEGQGQVEFAECLCGLRRPAKGSVHLAVERGNRRAIGDFRGASRGGVVYVPRDRKQEGLFYPLSTLDNFSLAALGELSRAGIIRRSAVRNQYRHHVELLRVKVGRPGDPVSTLSGGNQQKILLARWLATHPRVLVLNDPLRGVDANTKEELYVLLKRLALDGLSIVLVSTEILELLTLCDRIGVFHDAGLKAILPAAGTSDADVVAAMFGGRTKEGV